MYGKDSFNFHILEKCNSVEEMNEREVYWISRLNTVAPNGYNLEYGGGNTGSASDITKQKMSDNYKNNSELWQVLSRSSKAMWERPEYRENISKARKETWKDPEYRAKMSTVRKAFWNSKKGLKVKEDWKFPTYNSPRNRKLTCYSFTGAPCFSVYRVRDVEHFGFNITSVHESLRKGTDTRGHIWKYVDV